MKKRGMELAMQIVVISVILLIVLVVVGFIFGWGARDISTSLKDCQSKGGDCISKQNCPGGKQILIADCPKEGEVCCLK